MSTQLTIESGERFSFRTAFAADSPSDAIRMSTRILQGLQIIEGAFVTSAFDDLQAGIDLVDVTDEFAPEALVALTETGRALLASPLAIPSVIEDDDDEDDAPEFVSEIEDKTKPALVEAPTADTLAEAPIVNAAVKAPPTAVKTVIETSPTCPKCKKPKTRPNKIWVCAPCKSATWEAKKAPKTDAAPVIKPAAKLPQEPNPAVLDALPAATADVKYRPNKLGGF